MLLFPYLQRKYTTDFTPDNIKERVAKNILEPNWKFTFQKAIKRNIWEGIILQNGFIVSNFSYAMSYGRTSLLPYMTGKFKKGANSATTVSIIIMPSKAGTLGIVVVYLISLLIIYLSIFKNHNKGAVVVCSLLILSSYISILISFNAKMSNYLDFIEIDILKIRNPSYYW